MPCMGRWKQVANEFINIIIKAFADTGAIDHTSEKISRLDTRSKGALQSVEALNVEIKGLAKSQDEIGRQAADHIHGISTESEQASLRLGNLNALLTTLQQRQRELRSNRGTDSGLVLSQDELNEWKDLDHSVRMVKDQIESFRLSNNQLTSDWLKQNDVVEDLRHETEATGRAYQRFEERNARAATQVDNLSQRLRVAARDFRALGKTGEANALGGISTRLSKIAQDAAAGKPVLEDFRDELSKLDAVEAGLTRRDGERLRSFTRQQGIMKGLTGDARNLTSALRGIERDSAKVDAAATKLAESFHLAQIQMRELGRGDLSQAIRSAASDFGKLQKSGKLSADQLGQLDAQMRDLERVAGELPDPFQKLTQEFSEQRSVISELEHEAGKLGDRFHTLDLRHLGRDMDQSATATEIFAQKVDIAAHRLEQLGNVDAADTLRNLSRELRQAAQDGKSFANSGSQLLFDLEALRNEFDRVGSHVDLLDKSLGRDFRSIGEKARSTDTSIKGITVQIGLLRREADRLGFKGLISQLDTFEHKLQSFEEPLRGVDRALALFGSGADNSVERLSRFKNALGLSAGEVAKFKQRLADASQADEAFGRAVRIMAQRTIIFGASLTALLPFIGQFVGAIGSGVSGIFSMIAALSQLTGLLATLPGLFAAAAGAAGGLFGVIGPQTILGAVSGVLAAQKQKAAGSVGGGSSSGGDSGPTPAQLHATIMQNALQEKQAELELRRTKLDTYRALLDAERNLADVRKQATIDEATLKDDVTNAKARLKGLIAEGAPGSAIAAARADVKIAESQLAKQRSTDQKKIGDAESQLAKARVDGVIQVKLAELNLQQVRMSNAKQLEAAQKAGSTAAVAGAHAMALALAQLDPVQRRIVLQIVAIRNEFKKLTQPTRDKILSGFGDFLTFIQGKLPVIAKVLEGFANAIADIAGKFGHFIEKKQNFETIMDIFRAGIPLLRLFGDALFNIFKALVKIADAAKPLTTFVAKGVDNLAKSFSGAIGDDSQPGSGPQPTGTGQPAPLHGGTNPTSSLPKTKSTAIGAFLTQTRQAASQLSHILGDIFKLIGNLFKAAAPSGNSLLGSLSKFLDHLVKITGSIKGQNALKKFFGDQIPVVKALGGLIVAIFDGISKITDALSKPGKGGKKSALQTFIDQLKDDFIPFITDLLIQFTTQLGPSVFDFLRKSGKLLETLIKPGGPLKGAIDTLSVIVDLVQKVADGLDAAGLLGPIGYWIGIGYAVKIFSKVFIAGVLEPITEVPRRIKKMRDDYLEFTKEGGKLDNIKKGFQTLRDDISKVPGKLKDLAKGFKDFASNQIQSFTAGLKLMRDRIKELATSLKEGLVTRLKEFGSRIKELAATSWNKLVEGLKNTWLNIKVMAQLAWTRVVEGLKGTWQNLKILAATAWEKLVLGLKATVTQLKLLAATAWAAIVGGLKDVGNAIKVFALESLIPSLEKAGKAIKVFVFETLIPALARATAASLTFVASNPILLLVALIAIAVVLIATHWDQVKEIFFKALHFIEDLFDKFLDFFDKHWKVIALLAGPILGPIIILIHLIREHWDTIKKDALKAWNAIKDVLVGAWNRVEHFFTQTIPAAFNKIKGVFSGLWNDIKGGVTAGWDAIIGEIKHWIGVFAGLIDDVTGFLIHKRPLQFLENQANTSTAKPAHHGFAEGGVPDVGTTGHGIVRPVPGGVFRVAEAGHPEAIMSLDPRFADRTLQIIKYVMAKLHLGSFASGGIAGFAGGGIGAAGQNKQDPTKGLFNPGAVLGALKAVINFQLPTLSGPFAEMALGGLSKLKNSVVPFLVHQAEDFVGGTKGFLRKIAGLTPLAGLNDLAGFAGLPHFAEGGVTGTGASFSQRMEQVRSTSFASGGIPIRMNYARMVPTPGFSAGGLAINNTNTVTNNNTASQPTVNLTVNTASEKADIEYIMRVAEARMQRF